MLWDNPPHLCTIQSVASGTDAGGGVTLTTTDVQTGVKCSINTASASTRLEFAQDQIAVTHTIAFLTSDLTVTPQRGWQLTADDTGVKYLIQGIRRGRAYGPVPAFTYIEVSELL